MKELIIAGDSWSFGSEIINPKFKSDDVTDWDDVNDEYRNSNIYPYYLSKQLNIDNVKNLSFPAYSNDRIVRTLINYLTKYHLINSSNLNDIFVIVGLTSPERKDFYYKNKNLSQWVTMWPAWEHKYKDHDGMDDFVKSYITFFNNEQEYLNRYLNQVYYLQNFFKSNNIKYLIFQSFYQPTIFHNKISEWEDSPYINLWNNSFHGSTDTQQTKYYQGSSEPEIWKLIDDIRFMNKNKKNHSFHGYLIDTSTKTNENYFVGLHPNENAHKLWANNLYFYIKNNNLL